VNMDGGCHGIWLKDEMYGPKEEPPPLSLSCDTNLSPMRPTPSACGSKVTSCRLNYRTAQSGIQTKFWSARCIIPHSFAVDVADRRTRCERSRPGVLLRRRGYSSAIKLTSAWQTNCPFVVNRNMSLSCRVVIIRAVPYKCAISVKKCKEE
jgi:hypothetical protein